MMRISIPSSYPAHAENRP